MELALLVSNGWTMLTLFIQAFDDSPALIEVVVSPESSSPIAMTKRLFSMRSELVIRSKYFVDLDGTLLDPESAFMSFFKSLRRLAHFRSTHIGN